MRHLLAEFFDCSATSSSMPTQSLPAADFSDGTRLTLLQVLTPPYTIAVIEWSTKIKHELSGGWRHENSTTANGSRRSIAFSESTLRSTTDPLRPLLLSCKACSFDGLTGRTLGTRGGAPPMRPSPPGPPSEESLDVVARASWRPFAVRRTGPVNRPSKDGVVR
jgi:hypothetical protein